MTFTTEEKSILHQRRSHESIGHNANTSNTSEIKKLTTEKLLVGLKSPASHAAPRSLRMHHCLDQL